ncbi:uncharacterized protein zgc:113229 isoform X1 [Syngnathus acus]|uniref:uncharacterized protein zgc:113229 isoform X1 n=1 Tax=Syngnathus acus TaxID=161584 RepID=UPI0018860436|nr:uncharacterized protein zgc:113229 isoform X1 [Syngnathus acus]
MSQLSNPPNSQALLQSMLERLKLQPGRERHAQEHPGELLAPAPTWATDGVGSIQNRKKQSDALTNGFVFGDPEKRFEVSSVESTLSPKAEERLHGFEQYKSHLLFPPQRDKSHTGVDKVSTNITLSQISNSSTGQHLSTKGLPSSERTDTGVQQDNIFGNKEPDRGFQHNVHDWSWGSTDFTVDNQGNKPFHAVNGGFGDLSKWRDMHMIPHKGSSMTKRNQRSSENKARRWTRKLKERWLERPGKKGKEESEEDGTSMSSTQSHLISTLNQDTERNLPLAGSGENPTAPSEDDAIDAFVRSSDDFQFAFSSGSLLEEIVSGQEWAKFLNADLSVSSTAQGTPEKTLSSLDVTPKQNHNGPSVFASHQSGGLNRQRRFSSSNLPVPVRANSPETPTQNSTVDSETDQSEPMEQGQTQTQQKQEGLPQARTSTVERADILDDSPPTNRVNRKRQYQSAEMSPRREGQQGLEEKLPNSHEMGDAEVHDTPPFLNPNRSSASPAPSHFPPCGPVPRGILRHTNSDSSLESKRRRVEPNRRVHFAETVQVIPPLDVNVDICDSEDEYGTELGSEEVEDEEHVAAEEKKEEPTRRPALPAWIRALKKRNSGKKH